MKFSTLSNSAQSRLNKYYPFGSGENYTKTFGSKAGRYYSFTAYRYGFNNQEKDGELGEYYSFEYRVHDARLGRFLSVDPLFKKYNSFSNYSECGNNPIILLDKKGQDNIIYLIVLPSSLTAFGGQLTAADITKMVNEANRNFAKLGLTTRISVYNRTVNENTFDATKMATTDGAIVLGKREDVVKFIKEKDPDKANLDFLKDWDARYPKGSESSGYISSAVEVTQNLPTLSSSKTCTGGKWAAMDANILKDMTNMKKFHSYAVPLSLTQFGALVMNHSAGHMAGCEHTDEPNMGDPCGRTTSSIVKSYTGWRQTFVPYGNELTGPALSRAYESFSGCNQNEDYWKLMKDRFGTSVPKEINMSNDSSIPTQR